MCFAPQRRALFRHLNFQKWSENGVLCTFWLRNVLRATTACTFSTSQLPKVVRQWCVLYILTSKCASRHNGVHLFGHLNFQKWSENGVLCTFWLRNVLRAATACNFSSLIWPAGSAPAALASLLFDPPEPQIIGKTQCFVTFLPFRASASAFSWLFLFSDLLSSTLLFSLPLPSSAFHLSILSEVWLLNFLRSICVHAALAPVAKDTLPAHLHSRSASAPQSPPFGQWATNLLQHQQHSPQTTHHPKRGLELDSTGSKVHGGVFFRHNQEN